MASSMPRPAHYVTFDFQDAPHVARRVPPLVSLNARRSTAVTLVHSLGGRPTDIQLSACLSFTSDCSKHCNDSHDVLFIIGSASLRRTTLAR